MTPLILDIETGPGPFERIEPLLPKIEPPSNYKDAAKIQLYIAERKAELIEGAALKPELGRVLAVGILGDGEPRLIHSGSEAEILHMAWGHLTMRRPTECLVTFCGHRFDLPYLARRSWILGVPVPYWFPRDGRFPRDQYVDIAEIWACGNRTETISLDRLARALGLPGKSGDGAQFSQLWATDKQQALDYLANDLQLTKAVYYRLVPGNKV